MKARMAILLLVLIALGQAAYKSPRLTHVPLEYPASWPQPIYDLKKDPLSKEGIALGRKLFYDPILSKDGMVSCSSCHLSYTSFTHVDHALSHGVGDSIGTRNSPVLINLAWNKHFMWDGAISHLDMQALAPINHPAEMGETTASVVDKLQHTEHYPKLFQQVYGDSVITGQHLLKALSQFQLTLVSANSKYDRVASGLEAFTPQESNGYQLFKANCGSCHQEPLFTTGEFANNGLPVDSTLQDMGRMLISLDAADSLKFKIPTLRNIEFSFPYMHDGRFTSLRQVIDHYTEHLQSSPTLAPELQKGISLTANEKVDLTAFLLTLTDKEFLFNKAHAYPRDQY